jgi:hypothetical protein
VSDSPFLDERVWVVQRVDTSHGDELIAIYQHEADALALVAYYDDPQVQAEQWDVIA